MASHAATITAAAATAARQAILDPVPVYERDIPKIFEGEALPAIFVSQRRSLGRKPIMFEGQRRCVYVVTVVLIAGSNDDYTSTTNQYSQWRENLRELFGTDDFLAGTDVYQIEVDDDESYDLAALAKLNYAYWGLQLRYSTTE